MYLPRLCPSCSAGHRSPPPIADRIDALKQLHDAGIRTYAMIAPLLPGAEHLIPRLAGAVDYVYVDRINYGYADVIYRKHRLDRFRREEYFRVMGQLI